MQFNLDDGKKCHSCFFVYSPDRDKCPECGCKEIIEDEEERCPDTEDFFS